MKQARAVIFGVLLVTLLFPCLAITQHLKDISSIPEWRYKLSTNGSLPLIRIGDKIQKTIATTGETDCRKDAITSTTLLVSVQSGKSINFTATTNMGFPVIAVFNRPFHALDPGFLGIANTSLDVKANSAQGSLGFIALPGNPIAYLIGQGKTAVLELKAPYDGFWEVWVRVLGGRLAPSQRINHLIIRI